ncbi:MAG: hypothetical protein Q9227_009423 [Pyrenula ochraceoflavens]
MVDHDEDMSESRYQEDEEMEQKIINEDKDYSTHRLLIGTHTEGGASNYLQIAQVQLPNSQKPRVEDYDEETGEIGGYGGGRSKNSGPSVKFTIIQKIDHPGEVNKARYQPQNPNMIATMCTDGKVMIWDRTKHQSVPPGYVNPQIELRGHKREGFGLNWNPHEAGKLATAAEDNTVQLWDLNAFQKTNRVLDPARTYTHHSAVVNDVQYHPMHGFVLGTVSDDLTLQILDTRKDFSDRAVQTVSDGHRDAINAIAFNPKAETLFATGSADRTIAIWDLRYLKQKLHTLEGHHDTVTSLEWHPTEEYVLGSGSYDRRVIFWDLSAVGEEQTDEEKEDGPPEMLFMHGGHTNRISDFTFNKNDPWVVCSAAEDNLIQVWKPSMAIVMKDHLDDDVPNDELEQ